MKKILTISLIFSLIVITSFIKNSTKKIDEELFSLKESISDLNLELDNVKLEFDYLSSPEKLINYQNLYFENKLTQKNIKKIINKYDHIIDASDNFETKFLLNDFCFKYKKFLISGAISKFDGHIFSFDFKNKKLPCLRCFFQENIPSNDLLNCEAEGILGTVASTVGSIQANEILKKILSIGSNLNGYILILSLLTLTFRKAKITKIKNCICNK